VDGYRSPEQTAFSDGCWSAHARDDPVRAVRLLERHNAKSQYHW